VRAQESLKDDEAIKKTEVKDLLNSGRYTFEATKLLASNGTNSLIPKYDLDISKDTVIAYLPKSANEQAMPDSLSIAAGLQFTCTSFAYNLQQGKNGGGGGALVLILKQKLWIILKISGKWIWKYLRWDIQRLR